MARVEHWDRDRYLYERDRRPPGDGDRSERFESHDHQFRGPAGGHTRDHSDERFDRRPRAYDDDLVYDRRFFEDDVRSERRGPYAERDVVYEKDTKRDFVREASPPPPPPASRRPGFLRRHSSLDTFDRQPVRFYEREEYGPPARREQYRPEPYVPIPLPRTKALAPPRRMNARFVDDIRVADPDHYGDDDFRPYPERSERVREKEVVRTRRRDRSRDSLTSRSHKRTSRSSSISSRSSSRSRATTVRSEYPKKGKTKIPSRLVSKRALIDLGYPFIEEGNSIIVLKALGQENIDEVLRVSDEYKKSELEISAARSSAGNIIEDRREEVYVTPPRPVDFPPAPVVVNAAPPPPPPPLPQPQLAEVEVVKKQTVVRDVSPSRYSTTTGTTTTATAPSVYETREYREPFPAGALVIRDRSRSRSHSRAGRRELRAEIRALEAERHNRKHHRGDIVRAERLEDGQLVLYEEHVEKVDEGHRGPRLEKDRKGRMSISVPKRR